MYFRVNQKSKVKVTNCVLYAVETSRQIVVMYFFLPFHIIALPEVFQAAVIN